MLSVLEPLVSFLTEEFTPSWLPSASFIEMIQFSIIMCPLAVTERLVVLSTFTMALNSPEGLLIV